MNSYMVPAGASGRQGLYCGKNCWGFLSPPSLSFSPLSFWVATVVVFVHVIFLPLSVNLQVKLSSMVGLLDPGVTEIKIFSTYPPLLSLIVFVLWYLTIINTWFGE